MSPCSHDIGEISPDAILEQLARILSSKSFEGAERSVTLLKFLVEHATFGTSAPVKEYTLATEVLGKPSSFDPRMDTIVRAEVSRLRNRLQKYYATEGQMDPVVIALRKGRYEPMFQRRVEPAQERTDTSNAGKKPRRSFRRAIWLTSGIGLAACVVPLALMAFWRPPVGEPVSVAVLPFSNLSGDASQDFLSDGMTEELVTALAKIARLRVVARESAREFKDQKRDFQSMTRQLRASHVIAGSVRKSGNRVRVAAQLINAGDGTQLWAESYDRELTDLFVIEEEIARAIAASLHVPLGLEPGETLVAYRPKDQETYELYLRGVNALRLRNGEMRPELGLLEEVVARDPNYAPGWAKLAEARLEMVTFYERRNDESKRKPLLDGAAAAAKKAIVLAPGYAAGYGALAGVMSRRGRWAEAKELLKEGLARDPYDPELMGHHAALLMQLGYLKEGLAARERQHLLEPLVPLYNRMRAEAMAANGMTEAAIMEAERLCQVCVLFLLPAYAEVGRFAEVADKTETLLKTLPPSILRNSIAARPLLEAFAQSFRAAANKTAPPAQLPDFAPEWNYVYAYAGVPERMLDWPEKAVKEGDYRPIHFLWWPTPASVRSTERFKTLVRDAGLVDYWRAHGWPDLCHPASGDDFKCE